ncbi:LapA family protein [Pseudomonas sp. dw_358]|uniref:lipopolysaccharide assembly protein LapA domain-containing protein n=1 Tax=Pseudomonas sp. dw_358 TaxID=2720083 RepID=UPI001BD4AD6A|nr:LapA family protein [Pseudomonas sp. dw_358]
MGKLRKLVLIVVLLVVGITCLVFVLQNQQDVVLNFLTWSSPAIPVSVFVLCGLLLGMLIGPLLFSLKRFLRRRSRLTRAEAQRVAAAKSAKPVVTPAPTAS